MPKERAKQGLAVLYGMSCAAGAAIEAVQIRGGIDDVRIGLQPGPEVCERIKFRERKAAGIATAPSGTEFIG